MSIIRKQLIDDAINKIYRIYSTFHERFEIGKEIILADKLLTKDEKSEAIRILNEYYDFGKLTYNEGTKRVCENCQTECLATTYCENCIRNYLKANFLNWTSGNHDIDDLIQKCQIETIKPNKVVEWIPYNNLQNINYLTKGGCSEIYTAEWIGGSYTKWNSEEQQLKRFNTEDVILKKLKNVTSANRSWFDEAKSHLTIGNKWANIVKCFGLTQDPSNKDFILVMNKMSVDLREYLNKNHNQLTWKKRIQIIYNIIDDLNKVHGENAIHRDLHSGNILYYKHYDAWYISDLGFCGPADRPLKSIYGNLSYIAPEVIAGERYTFKSDIYSVAMLMWEISSGQPPFANFKHSDYDLAMDIVNGMRPKIIPGTPLEYKRLMQQCWDADPLNRPDIGTARDKIFKIRESHQNNDENKLTNNDLNISYLQISASSSSMNSFVSKVYNFEGIPVPRNATEEEQEVYHSKLYSFAIPENIEDIMSKDNKPEQNDLTMINDKNSEEKKIFYSNNSDAQYTCNSEAGFQRNYTVNNDEYDETYNNPNLHSNNQEKLEISYDVASELSETPEKTELSLNKDYTNLQNYDVNSKDKFDMTNHTNAYSKNQEITDDIKRLKKKKKFYSIFKEIAKKLKVKMNFQFLKKK